MKALIIGDCHFKDGVDGYLDSQISSILSIIEERKPKYVIFLGDIFDARNPKVSEIVPVFYLFYNLSLIPGLSQTFVMRGNHDSANKSDDGLSILNCLSYQKKIEVILSDWNCHWQDLGLSFVPHYENDDLVREILNDKWCQDLVFGHFGYEGCLNTFGYNDFGIKKEEIKKRTILGHIHKYCEDGNITILGTPYSTCYSEVDYKHYVGEITRDKKTGKWSELEKIEVESGPRHYICPFESLEQMKEDISNPKFFTLLRVLMNKFTDETSNDLKNKIKEEFKVAHVELVFQPVYDKKLEKRLSNFETSESITEIDDDILDKYIEENATNIPVEKLKEGLEMIKANANQEDNS